MQPSKIDELVVQHVMAFGRSSGPEPGDKVLNYSTRDQLAFEVVDHMLAQGWRGFSLELVAERQWLATFVGSMPIDTYSASSTTRATAICLAALAAMGVEQDEEEDSED